jgi:hypothetical protein
LSNQSPLFAIAVTTTKQERKRSLKITAGIVGEMNSFVPNVIKTKGLGMQRTFLSLSNSTLKN